MKATEAKLLGFLKKSPQFIIPIYQRTYSWTERECRQLWDDIIRTGLNDGTSAHFVGSIVYIEQGLYQVTSQSPLLVIDGQQRLTTVTLLLCALAKALEKQPESAPEPIDGFSARKIRNYYLLNPDEDGDRHFRLLLSQTDKDTLIALVSGNTLPKEQSIRIVDNFALFESFIAQQANNLAAICKGLAKLVVVDIALSRDQDNPQLIFESMNSTGRELTQADLIRNFILMGLEPGMQTALYQNFWRPMEVDFGQAAYISHFDAFMRHYLTVKAGEIPNIGEVYEAFKTYSRQLQVKGASVEALVRDIRQFSKYFCAMALGAETDPDLRMAFQDLRELKVDVAYPFLMELYNDYAAGTLAKEDFLEAIRLIESYVFRRSVCAIPTNSMNKTFARFAGNLKKDRYLESIQAHFLNLPSYRRFPTDEEFRREIRIRDLYNFRNRSYWLRRLENHGRKERVLVDEYTIEHIMPQNPNLPPAWQKALGREWQRVHETWLHTLGNLTLTGYNPEYSDRPFIKKRDMPGGFKESPLKLNQGLGQLDTWDEEAIEKRAGRLSNMALKVWRSPGLSEDVLASYREGQAKQGYNIEDHPNLAAGPMRDLFESFRKQVMGLDPCVTEEFLKLYVAYKAETNFVDVIPQQKRLCLNLNLEFSEVNDPKGLCRDVSGLGRWGNGEVEVGLASEDDLPYVIGLVRQALEKQMGSTGDA